MVNIKKNKNLICIIESNQLLKKVNCFKMDLFCSKIKNYEIPPGVDELNDNNSAFEGNVELKADQ